MAGACSAGSISPPSRTSSRRSAGGSAAAIGDFGCGSVILDLWAARLFRARSGILFYRLLVLLGVILTQRMTDEFLVQIDAAQIGMPGEANAVKIPGLALQPVGARPDFAHG